MNFWLAWGLNNLRITPLLPQYSRKISLRFELGLIFKENMTMRRLAIILASTVLTVSAVGMGAAFAQTSAAPPQPDATTAAPTTTAPAPMKKAKHQKVAMNKHHVKTPKKPTAQQPAGDDSTQQPAQ